MRSVLPISRALCALTVVVVTAATWSTPSTAHADPLPPSVRVIDRRIHHADAAIQRWQRLLARWQIRVGKAEARVQRLTFRSSAPTEPVDVLRRGMVRRLIGQDPVKEAHRDLQRVLRDHDAQEAMAQTTAWNEYLGQLHRARDRAVREAAAAAAAGGIVSIPVGPVTYQGWAKAFLSALQAPSCGENLVLVVAWETQESTVALYNPLATSHDMSGASTFNDAGVKNYVSVEQGVEASRDTLLGGAESLGYGAIVADLQACTSAETTAATIRDSAWCRGCGGGMYLVGLLPLVRSTYAEHAARLISTAV